ncbi:hypothetical protein L9F63_020812 [Diploptera punctata]|uniref:A-kinase anchor protein 2 C-terminal domain-containing protein n=1 Tax=Diploptera punctata TaxID=6984 RepID=A0AAD8EBY7_DIPPU|nr:hypothetical protein L9F63_020812 [Diploptera punctata]
MGTLSSGFVSAPATQQKPAEMPLVVRRHSLVQENVTSQDYEGKENGEIQRSTLRRGYISAEEKIQVELEEMQKREEELRLQRAKIFAQSQPNLLSIGMDEDDKNETGERGDTLLRSALSNPNLLNSENTNDVDEESSIDKVRK